MKGKQIFSGNNDSKISHLKLNENDSTNQTSKLKVYFVCNKKQTVEFKNNNYPFNSQC